MFDLGEDEERFYNFLNPFTSKSNKKSFDGGGKLISISCCHLCSNLAQFESLGPILMDTSNFPSEEAKKAIIGLGRDLRGLAQPLNVRLPFTMLFEWL